MRAALESFAANLSTAKAAPEGWKLVPLIATREMIERARTATVAANFRVDGEPPRKSEAQERILLNAAYTAILAAAPQPEVTK